MEKQRFILVLEEDELLQSMIAEALNAGDFRPILVKTVEEVLTAVDPDANGNALVDMMLLDMDTTGVDGIALIKSIRRRAACPMIAFSATVSDKKIIEALDAGADNYVKKPLALDVLMARIRVLNRHIVAHVRVETQPIVFKNGPLTIEYSDNCARYNGEVIRLTLIEYKLLCLLAKNLGKVLTHQFILSTIWGIDDKVKENVGTLRVFMATLRRKLSKLDPNVHLIQTHIGVGYRMVAIDADDEDVIAGTLGVTEDFMIE